MDVVKNNNFSIISVTTVDNAITNYYVGIVNDTNCSKKLIIKRRGKRLLKKIKIQYYRNQRKEKRKARSIFVTKI